VELRTLRYFVAIAETGTVSAAAEVLHVTQPGLSRQLRQLERDLGVTLFDRVQGRLLLSAAGRDLLPQAHDVLAGAYRLAQNAQSLATGRLDHLTIAAPVTTLTEVVSPFIATLGADDPTPSVVVSDGREPAAALRGGADLVITNGRPGDAVGHSALAVLPVWAYVPTGHEWADTAIVDIAAVLEEPIIGLPLTFSARQMLDAAALNAGLAPRVDIEVSSGAVAQALAAAGRGIAVVTDDPRFGLHPLRIAVGAGELSIRLYAAWDHHHIGAPTLRAFAQRLSQYIVGHYGVTVRPVGV
jgi:LysR family transcriptional regulator, benzoate and cis,cis-muconate-responsive activator of ben and cat genes